MAHAGEDAARCVDASVPKHAAEVRHGKWIELTSDHWQFLRGIYAVNPLTPPGLPLRRQGRARQYRRPLGRHGVLHRRR
jgi:hypothetical protein